MSQQELLTRVVSVLNAAGIEYMLTGSIVSSIQGQPRSTHDIDLIVNIAPSSVAELIRAFPSPDYYLDDVAMAKAINQRDMFNLLEIASGDKVDFWVLKRDVYDCERFARRQQCDIAGIKAFISRPEDTVLQKLRWSVMSGGSEKQFNDALHVYELQYALLDLGYMERWSKDLGMTEPWERLKREAEPLD